MAGWGQIASNLARLALQDSHKKIVDTLEVDSEVLDNIHEEFVLAISERNIRIHTFQEGQGISGMKGFHGKVCWRPLNYALGCCTDHCGLRRS